MHEPSPSDKERLRLADLLAADRERIMEEWMAAVSADEQIPAADRLTVSALRDHFPLMLRELADGIRRGGSLRNDADARETGEDHGQDRWRHGYRLTELLREVARLREIILRRVSSADLPGVSAPARDAVSEAVRFYFDTISSTSAEQYVRAQEGEVILRSSQLELAYQQVQAATARLRSTAESRLSLLRAVNHELRNALQPVTLVAHALREESHPVNRQELRERLTSVTLRLQALLDRVFSLSQLLAGEARARALSVSLPDLVCSLADEFRPIAEARGLRFECPPVQGRHDIISDPDRLREIGSILLSNALRFTTAGFIRLETLAADDDRWILRVTDSGRGVDPLDARHIFHSFQFRGAAEPGLHLGLVLSRHLARLLGGDVTFESVVGEGSVFEVNLPSVLPADEGA